MKWGKIIISGCLKSALGFFVFYQAAVMCNIYRWRKIGGVELHRVAGNVASVLTDSTFTGTAEELRLTYPTAIRVIEHNINLINIPNGVPRFMRVTNQNHEVIARLYFCSRGTSPSDHGKNIKTGFYDGWVGQVLYAYHAVAALGLIISMVKCHSSAKQCNIIGLCSLAMIFDVVIDINRPTIPSNHL